MKVLDLFSGIGGFSIGLEEAGFETAAFCEIEDYPRAVIRKHWPDTPIYRDVRQLTGEQLRADGIVPDLLCGGYPCQPFSVAGRQRGEEDPRHLWPEVHRLIRELRPRWVVCENVSGHIKLGLDEVLSTLEAEGYTCWPFIIPACSVDAPHKRDRVWIVAHADSSSDRRASRQYEEADGKVSQRDNGRFFDQSGEIRATDVGNAQHDGSLAAPLCGEPEEASRGSSQGQEPTEQSARAGGRKDNGNVADSDSDRPQRSGAEQVYGVGDLSRQSGGGGTDLRGGWPVEPNVGRVVDGLPRRSHRIKALGNAIVPQIAQAIGETIMRFEETRGE
jgi:DNA (cytosine-5)-methyltransferase 1